MRRDPLARAMRPDKATLAAVALTLGLYRSGRAVETIPVWRMIATPRGGAAGASRGAGGDARSRAPRWSRLRSTVGGGSLPGETLPSFGLALEARSANGLLAALRRGEPAVIGRIEDDRVVLDLRTVEPEADDALGRRDRPGPRRTGMTVVIGTAGHIDHGKTTLLRALTGIDADRLPEERRRGMTIDVGYAHLAFDDGIELDFVDVPGHDRLVGNMLVGAGEIDAALLVVAADDGPRAQTLEHLALLDALGIRDGVAVVTKIDAVDAGAAREVVDAVAALLDGTSLAGVAGPAPSPSTDGRRDRRAAPCRSRRPRRRRGPVSRGDRSAADARDRPGLLGQGPRHRGDGHAPRRPAGPRRVAARACPGDGTRASASSRSTTSPVERPGRAGRP